MKEVGRLLAALTSGDDNAAEAAAVRLGALGPSILPELKQLVNSRDADTRWWAVRVLARMEAPPIEWLMRALEDAAPEIRQCAALALCHHPGQQAVMALAAHLADDDPMVAGLAANALTAIGSPATPALLEVLQGGAHPARIEAARALCEIRDPRAIPVFMKMLESESAMLHYWAETGLEKLGLGMVYLKPE